MTADGHPTTPHEPHEPEIEALARVARGFLWGVRRLFWLAGAVAIGYGLIGLWQKRTGWSEVTPGQLHPLAHVDAVWLCVGLPLLVPVDWLFGRGRWWALALLATLWFAPRLLGGDDDFGYLLRIFASGVACASLLVWRTLWRLTKPA